MPLYEYECAKCSQVTEIIQKFSDPPLKECPECKGSVRRLMSKTSFRLKGTGWYETDYKKKPAPETAPKEEKAKSAAPETAPKEEKAKSTTSETAPKEEKAKSTTSETKPAKPKKPETP